MCSELPDERAAWLDGIEKSVYLGPRGSLEYFDSAAGQHLASYYWPAEGEAKAVILLVHGASVYAVYDYLRLEVRSILARNRHNCVADPNLCPTRVPSNCPALNQQGSDPASKLYDGSWVEVWNKAGISVCSFDLHGHGRSSGLHGYTQDVQLYVDEILQFAAMVKASDKLEFAGLPVYGVGGCLGGTLLAMAAACNTDMFAGG
jgi:hypothetical protein